MNDTDFSYIARNLASLSGIPVRVFEKEELKEIFSVVRLPKDPFEICRDNVFAIKDNVGYYVSPRFHIYGVINSDRVKIVVGPTTQLTAGDQSLRELAFQLDIPKDETQTFVDSMKGIVRMPLECLLTMLCSVNYMLNGDKLELKDLAIRSEEQQIIKRRVEQHRTSRTYDEEPPQAVHNTLQLEETLMDFVHRGDTAALRQWISYAPPVRAGIIAPDQLRQLRNTFIVTATLTSRAAIRGGLSAEDAFTLSDAYIQRVEQLHTQNEIINLQFNMVLEFTEQVEKVRLGKNPTKLAVDVANYVQHHLSERISTDTMAKEFYLSRTHLSAKFKKETGMTLTDFILKEKTEEAKRLLRYSDKPAAAISAYLGFSSHGHFSKVFKQYAGLTPNEYREKHSH